MHVLNQACVNGMSLYWMRPVAIWTGGWLNVCFLSDQGCKNTQFYTSSEKKMQLTNYNKNTMPYPVSQFKNLLCFNGFIHQKHTFSIPNMHNMKRLNMMNSKIKWIQQSPVHYSSRKKEVFNLRRIYWNQPF